MEAPRRASIDAPRMAERGRSRYRGAGAPGPNTAHGTYRGALPPAASTNLRTSRAPARRRAQARRRRDAMPDTSAWAASTASARMPGRKPASLNRGDKEPDRGDERPLHAVRHRHAGEGALQVSPLMDEYAFTSWEDLHGGEARCPRRSGRPEAEAPRRSGSRARPRTPLPS